MWRSLNVSLDLSVKKYEMLRHHCGKAGSFRLAWLRRQWTYSVKKNRENSKQFDDVLL